MHVSVQPWCWHVWRSSEVQRGPISYDARIRSAWVPARVASLRQTIEGQLGGARVCTNMNWRMLAFSSGMHLLLAVPPSLIVCVAATQESSEAQEAR